VSSEVLGITNRDAWNTPGQGPEKRKTYERLTQAINEARDEEKGRH